MENSGKALIEEFLRSNGVSSEPKIEEVVSGFDLTKSVYLEWLHAGDQIFQFTRNPSALFNSVSPGNWFCLKGASMDALAIFSGGTGRHLTEYRVKHSISVLEGTARTIELNWDWAGGGMGGATQMFIPNTRFFALETVGSHF